MAQYIGLSKKDALLKIQSDAIKAAREEIDNYYKNVNKLVEMANSPLSKKEKFWGGVSIIPAFIYSLIKGAFDSVTNGIAAIAYTIENAFNDAKHIFDDTDGTSASVDAQYALKNFGISLFEGISSGVVSTGADIGRVFGIDPEWAFGEDGVINDIAEKANRARIQSLYGNKDAGIGLKPGTNISLGNTKAEQEKVNERYYSEIQKAFKVTGNVQKWISKNVVDNVANIVTLGLKENADHLLKDSEFYNALIGTAESIGNILLSRGIAKIGGALNLPVSSANALSSAYFASTIFGSGFQEALDNGANLQDAYTYALGNAFIETAIENVSGFTTSGAKEAGQAAKKSLFEKALGMRWGGLVQNAFEEGMEEVYSAFATPGLERYKNADNAITSTDFKDFASQVLFSFIGGAVASGILGIAQNMYINTTAEGRSQKIVDEFNKDVKKGEEEKTVDKFKKGLDELVEYLNKPNAKGLKSREISAGLVGAYKEGVGYIGTLTLQEKKQYLKKIGLNKFIEEKDGKFVVTEKAKKLDANIFRNRVGDKIIDDDEYAINKATRGVDITDGGTAKVVKMDERNDRGKKILEIANKRNVAIAVVDENKKYLGRYGSNGVIYINQNEAFKMTDKEIEETIIKHEIVHHIATENPKLFEELKDEITHFAEFEIDEKAGKPSVVFKNPEIEKILKAKEYDKIIKESFNTYLDEELERLGSISFETGNVKQAIEYAIDLTEEEIVAYFVEDILEGGKFIDIISDNKKGLFERVKELFSKKSPDGIEELIGNNKQLVKQLKNVRKKFEEITKHVVSREKSIAFFTKHIFGSSFDIKTDFFKEEILKEYSFEYLWDVLWEHYEKVGNFIDPITIDGKKYSMFEIIKADFSTVRPMRLARPDWDKMYDEFKFDENKKEIYIKLLKEYIEDFAGITDDEIREEVGYAEELIDDINDGKKIEEGAKFDFLAELATDYEYNKEYRKWKKEQRKTPEALVIKNAIQKAVVFLNDPTKFGINGWRNFAKTEGYNCAYYRADFKDEKQMKNCAFATQFALDLYYHYVKGSDKIGEYRVEYQLSDDKKYFELLVYPTDEYVEKKLKGNAIQEQREQEKLNMEVPEKPKGVRNSGVEDAVNALNDLQIEHESKNKIEINDDTTIEDLSKIPYDDNNIVVGNTPFWQKKEAEFLNKAFEVAPVVSLVMPGTWKGSYLLQRQVFPDKKLIYNEPISLKTYRYNIRVNSIKTVAQVWVNKNDSRFKDRPNLRTLSMPKTTHSDFLTFVLTGGEEKYKQAKYFDFDFAVFREGNSKDFTQKVREYDELAPKGHYVLIKANSDEALSVLESIDFDRLANIGSTCFKGFTTYDLVSEYETQKKVEKRQRYRKGVDSDSQVRDEKPTSTPNIRFKLASTEELEQKEKDYLHQFFGNRVVSELFEKRQDGSYVLKNKFIINANAKKGKVKIDGKIYSDDKYAVNTFVDLTTTDIKNNHILISEFGFKEPILLSKLNKDQKAVYDFFKSAQINFVFYEPLTKSGYGYGGFSISSLDSNVAFVNIATANNGSQNISEFIFHETMHEIFKIRQLDSLKFARSLSEILVKKLPDGSIVESEIYNILNRNIRTWRGNFLEYLKIGYLSVDNMRHIKLPTIKHLYDFLNRSSGGYDNDELRVVNEIVAQMFGAIFSDREIYSQVFRGKSETIIPMYELFSLIKNNMSINEAQRALLQDVSLEFDTLFRGYAETLKKHFPFKRDYTLADLNKFIKDFTDGSYTTKSALIEDYIKRKRNAREVVNNIIYVASLFAPSAQKAVNVYEQIKQEFERLKEGIEYLLNNEEELFVLSKGYLKKSIKTITNLFSKELKIRSSGGNSFEVIFWEKLRSALVDFVDYFLEIPDQILDLFNFPNRDAITDDVIKIIQSIDIKKYDKIVDLLKIFVPKLSDFNKILKDNNDVFKNIAKLIENNRKANVDYYVQILETKLNSTLSKIKNTGLQSTSPLSNIIRKIAALISGGKYMDDKGNLKKVESGIIGTLRGNPFNFKHASAEIVAIVGEMKKAIETAPELSDDVKDETLKLFEVIYKQLAALFNDISILRLNLPIGGSPTAIDRKYFALDLKQIIRKFNPHTFASALMKVLENVQTKYTSVFGGDILTRDEYSKKTIKQAGELDGKVKTNTLRFQNFNTHQEFFLLFKQLFGDKIDFFNDFYDEYIKSVRRRSDIEMEYRMSFAEWEKRNKGLVEYSLERIPVSIDYLVPIRSDIIEKMRNEALEEEKVASEFLQGIKKQLAEANAEIKVVNAEFSKIKKQLKEPHFADAASQATLKKRLQELEKQKDQLKKHKFNLNQEKVKATIDVKIKNADMQLKLKINKYVNDNRDSFTEEKQMLMRGQIIATYLSVSREIEMHEIIDSTTEAINPTNHFFFGNEIRFFDNELMRRKGYLYAKENAVPFVIYANKREELRDYLESLLEEKDFEIINFAKQRFDKNYEYLDEIFFAKYKVHLPKQSIYIPFSTIESDYAREIDLRIHNRRNIAAPDGMVTETTEGATTALRIENIFGTLDNHTQTTANYSFERIITDWQNLLVNKTGGTSLEHMLTGEGNLFGKNNGFIKGVESAFIDNLRYSDITEGKYSKLFSWFLRNSAGAIMALNVPAMIKQFASISTIIIKNGLNFADFVKNVTLSLGKSKYRDWLMKNNSNFNQRAISGNVPALAEKIDTGAYYTGKYAKLKGLLQRFKQIGNKMTNVLTKHIGWIDNAILVGAFKTYADDIRSKEQSLTEEEVMRKANEKLWDILLYGVANTDPGFRSSFSNSRHPITMSASKFQPENILHVSALLRITVLVLNNIKGSIKMFMRDLLALILSGLFSAIVSTSFNRMRGYIDEDEVGYDLLLNELLWNNIVGAIPIVNQFTSMISFEKGKGLTSGFKPKMPLLAEVYEITNLVVSMENGANVGRKMLKIFEYAGQIFGLPFKNATRFVSTVSNVLGERGVGKAEELSRFLHSKTKAQGFSDAIKKNNRQQIKLYVEDVFSNLIVANEITRLMFDNSDEKLSLYDVTYFRKLNDEGTYDNINIPQDTNDKYKDLSQKALQRLIRSGKYKRLDDKSKIAAMQRVINYYYNFMKSVVLEEKREMSGINDVVERAIKYSA